MYTFYWVTWYKQILLCEIICDTFTVNSQLQTDCLMNRKYDYEYLMELVVDFIKSCLIVSNTRLWLADEDAVKSNNRCFDVKYLGSVEVRFYIHHALVMENW